MKKEKLIGVAALTAATVAAIAPMKAEARPHGGFGGPRHHFVAPHRHHHSFWGHGGRHFWPGFTGGVVGGIIGGSIYRTYPVYTTPVYTAPVVVQQPVYQQPVVVQQPVYQYQEPVIVPKTRYLCEMPVVARVEEQPFYQAPVQQQQQTQSTEVKVVVEHRYLTAEEAARAAREAQNQKQ